MGQAAPERTLARLGRDREAERSFTRETLEAIAAHLTTPGLRRSFLGAGPVGDVYRALGRRAPAA